MKRVVITGLGVVCPIGVNCDAFWSGLISGQSGIGQITLFDASTFPVRIGGEVRGFDTASTMASFPEAASTHDRKVLLALAAAEEAIGDARLTSDDLHNALICMGVGLETICLEDLTPYAQSPDFVQAIAGNIVTGGNGHWLQTPLDRTAEILGNRYGFLAGRYTNCSACAAGTQVIGEAWQMLRRGQADVALAGAADSMINPLGLGGFSLLHVLSSENECPRRACRPFDCTRQGTVLGEGAAFLVLESLDRASARGAAIHAEVLGYGSSLDAFAPSDPDPTGHGAAESIRRALRSAGLRAENIDCVNAHGTGTPKNDAIETAAIKQALGRRAYEIPVHAVKSMTGHMIAASGAVEAVASALTLTLGMVPPTINLTKPDPQCDLDYVPEAARPFQGKTVLSNSFGFGGQNATIILGKYTQST
jgi:3-oxoacyl-[acyl-carrier-protein] synthase II